MEVAVFLRSEGRICPDIPLPNNCQVTDLVYFFSNNTEPWNMPVKGGGWSWPFDGIEGQEGREEATCPYFQSGGCPGGLWTPHLPLWKINFLMIGLSARGQRKQSSWWGKTTQYPSIIAISGSTSDTRCFKKDILVWLRSGSALSYWRDNTG